MLRNLQPSNADTKARRKNVEKPAAGSSWPALTYRDGAKEDPPSALKPAAPQDLAKQTGAAPEPCKKGIIDGVDLSGIHYYLHRKGHAFFSKLTLPQLHYLCEVRSLEVKGTDDEVRQRLQEFKVTHQHQKSAGADPSADAAQRRSGRTIEKAVRFSLSPSKVSSTSSKPASGAKSKEEAGKKKRKKKAPVESLISDGDRDSDECDDADVELVQLEQEEKDLEEQLKKKLEEKKERVSKLKAKLLLTQQEQESGGGAPEATTPAASSRGKSLISPPQTGARGRAAGSASFQMDSSPESPDAFYGYESVAELQAQLQRNRRAQAETQALCISSQVVEVIQSKQQLLAALRYDEAELLLKLKQQRSSKRRRRY